jgi:hypothetical protein
VSTIKQRAKELGKEIEKLYKDAMEAGEEFTVTFKAPSIRRDEDGEVELAGFSLVVDEDIDYDEEDNEIEVKVFRGDLEHSWYHSSLHC